MNMQDVYFAAKGFVISYKDLSEPMLFNELNAFNCSAKLKERSGHLAVFYIDQYHNLLEKIKEKGLVFAQHIYPFLTEQPVTGEKSDLALLYKTVKHFEKYFDKNEKYICQCRIKSAEQFGYTNGELTDFLSNAFQEDGYFVDTDQVNAAISITIVGQTAYFGLSYLDDNISRWNGGVLFYAKEEDIICRAEFKLEEAFDVFHIKAFSGMTALDLGASPGGWTHYLNKKGIFVDAVDPAELDHRLSLEQKIKHYKMTAQEFLRENPKKSYDMIVNDMKMDTNNSIDIMCEMGSRLNGQGCCLMTLKLPKQQVQKRIQVAKTVLLKKFANVQMRQLYYNRSEVTVFMENPIFNK